MSSIRLRSMAAADLPFADTVRALAGWNQTLGDWQRFLDLAPEGCFVAEWDGIPAGTATTTTYGTDLAWIGMVLVHPDYRRRGIGRALLEHCLDFLQHRRIRCIKLDATPLGRPLYGQLGFQEEWSLARWQRDSNPIPSSLPSECASSRTRPPAANEFEELDKLDQTGFGVSRRDLLARLIASGSSLIQTSDSNALLGYACSRVGSKATYFGPATAGEATDGVTLVRELLTTITDGPCFWDIPDPNAPAIALAEELGFSRQRPLYRMYLGENKNPGVPTRMFAIADPAMG